jgi:DNA-binding XRE family transcriptional regulator
MIDYPRKFRELRKHFNITQEVLGTSVDSTRHVIAQIELGKNRPSLELVRQIAIKYRIKYEFFFEPDVEISQCVEEKIFPAHESSASMIKHLGISTKVDEKKEKKLSDEELIEILKNDDRAYEWFNKLAGKKFSEFLEKERKELEKDLGGE